VETRLLLVDDEPALLDLLKRYLERLGYQVDARTSPREALALFEADPVRYSLVLTDLTLPEMSGEEMLERMRDRQPRLAAIVASGYPHHPQSRQTGFLLKPFLPNMLAAAIEDMLKSGSRGPEFSD